MAVLGTAMSAVSGVASAGFAVGRVNPLRQTQLAWHAELTSSFGAEYLAAGLIILLTMVGISVARVWCRIFKQKDSG